MTDTATRIAGPQPPNPNTFNPIATVNLLPGTPVCSTIATDGEVTKAKADSVNTTYVQGLCSSAGAAGEPVHVQNSGPLSLTTAEWDAITGDTGGLTNGVPYYLSAATAGKLTTTAPSSNGQFREPVGIGQSATTMIINILPAPVIIAA